MRYYTRRARRLEKSPLTPQEKRQIKAFDRERHKYDRAYDRVCKKLFRQRQKIVRAAEKRNEKNRGTKIEIGRPGKKAESIKIGGIDLLRLVRRIERLEKKAVKTK
jgi:hypothetical protein